MTLVPNNWEGENRDRNPQWDLPQHKTLWTWLRDEEARPVVVDHQADHNRIRRRPNPADALVTVSPGKQQHPTSLAYFASKGSWPSWHAPRGVSPCYSSLGILAQSHFATGGSFIDSSVASSTSVTPILIEWGTSASPSSPRSSWSPQAEQ